MELEIMNDYNAGRVVVYCWTDLTEWGMRFYSYNGDHIETTDVEGPVSRSAEGAKPLLVLPARMANEVFKLFAAQLAKQNIHTENENLLKGKLEATERHLADMRELNKLFSLQLKPIDPAFKDAVAKSFFEKK